MKYDFKEVEKRTLQFWKEKNIHQKANKKNKGKDPFYFLDGPPYTSGRVHIGTAWNKSLKDCILRYKRMKGFDVVDRAGYDMHGLPTENATQKKLNLKTKEDINTFGVKKFIEECKQLCIDNMNVMNEDFKNLGVWMDFENAYQSIKKEYMSGEWWLIKEAHKKGRLYEGLRTMTWCSESESALAKHELEYKTVTDDSIFVKFKVKGKENEYILVWTTTPWTIPLNLAVMVNPTVDYVKAKVDNEYWWIAAPLAGVFIQSVVGKEYTIEGTLKGDQLEGLEYIHPFHEELKEDYERIKKESPKAHTIILSEEYVDTSSGTGLVHSAPGCGPQDYEVGHRNGIAPFNPIDERGVFPESMGKFHNLIAKTDDKKFIELIDETGALVAKTKVEHEYPHDWRHKKPVIYRTTKQWFFKVEDIKEQLITQNNNVKWVPDAGFNAFDSWLKNLRDNSISKQRFWGTPIPIWRNIENEDDYLVIGSAEELEELAGQKVDDLHISTVDDIEIKKEGKTYKRIPDILDVWVDAGSASWNCLNFPKEKEQFEKLYPADFILEGKDQIRGWFNLLMVASTIAFNNAPFKNVYMHGFVQDAQGRKMSKSLGNYIVPEEVIGKFGADSFRYYIIGGANPGVDLNYNFDDIKVRHKNITVLWNVHNYLLDLCKTYNLNPSELEKVRNFGQEESYMFSKLNTTIQSVSHAYDTYRLNEVPQIIEDLYLELSRTYIQLIRDKAALGSDEDRELVVFTIYRVLMETLKMLATIAPFITEEMYQDFKKAFSLEEESIHLFDFPKTMDSLINVGLEKDFSTAQTIIQAILAGRDKIQRGVRWPISEVTIVMEESKLLEEMIKKQTNVKKITLVKKLESVKNKVKYNFKAINQSFGGKAAGIIARLTHDSADTVAKHLEESTHKIEVDGEKYEITKDHVIFERITPDNLVESEFRGGFLYVHKEMDDHLLAEGFSRELMRRVQQLRKEASLEKKDSIALVVKADEDLVEMLLKWEDAIKEKVGATKIKISEENPARKMEFHSEEKVKNKGFEIWIEKV